MGGQKFLKLNFSGRRLSREFCIIGWVFSSPDDGRPSHPEPFRCSITPRSKEAIALIQAEYDEKSEYI